ncbi:Trypsin [Popillia japonica]|uniref:Trypsin n=1 Tax=Popillia japonica TaxID=7064 RepID=A0AAW1JZG4_POPJA
MKAVQFVVFCVILVLVSGYQRYFWIGHGGVCKSSYDYTYYCIHYSHCQPSFYRFHPRGHSKICGIYLGVITMCCAEEEEYPEQSYFVNNKYFHTQNAPPVAPSEIDCEPTTTTPKISTPILVSDTPPTTQNTLNEDVPLPQTNIPELVGDTTVVQENIETTTRRISNEASQDKLPEPEQDTPIIQGGIDTAGRISDESSPANLPESSPNSTTSVIQGDIDTTGRISNESTPEQNTPAVQEPETNTFTSTSLIDSDINVTSDLGIVANITTTTANVITADEDEDAELDTLNTQAVLADIQNLASLITPLVSAGSRPRIRPPMQEEFALRTTNVLVDITRNIDQTVTNNLPYYPPTLENSTSLRMCSNWYGNVSGENAFLNRTTNKAELGYGNEANIQWSCGGTLISERYVLTAARCQFLNMVEPVRYVRLGNSRNASIPNQQLQNFTVESFTPHPLFDTSLPLGHHDIALIRLNATAIISDLVMPACLSTKFDISSVPLWLISGGPINFVHISANRCQQFFNDTGLVDISNTLQECAVTDSYFYCEYEAGNPFIFITTDYKFGFFPAVVSIASYGQPCEDTPAVSTRVLAYIPWIERIVWPAQ